MGDISLRFGGNMADSNSTPSTTDLSWQQTWGSREFVERWATKGGWQAPFREVQTAMVLRMIPHPLDAPIRVLDIGAGYGALAVAVLNDRPSATAVCLDASEAMLKLGRERTRDLKDRISFIQGSLESSDWLKSVDGTFDAIISSRALHHFTENQRRRHIFREVFGLVRPGGCFLNADNVKATTKSLSDRYRRARDEYLDRFVRESTGGKTNLTEVARRPRALITARITTATWKKSLPGSGKPASRMWIAFGSLLRRWFMADSNLRTSSKRSKAYARSRFKVQGWRHKPVTMVPEFNRCARDLTAVQAFKVQAFESFAHGRATALNRSRT
jgi:ubiquinone/menaquinone biosynthesis C-methylase UbiE